MKDDEIEAVKKTISPDEVEQFKKDHNKSTADLTDEEFFDSKLNTSGITSKELLDAEFPEPEWIIKDLIPEGFAILAGKPKCGKSWLTLQMAADLSIGVDALGKYSCKPTEVLYLALEDSYRRLRSRLDTLKGFGTEKLRFYAGTMSRADKDAGRADFPVGIPGIQALENRLETFPNTKLIVIDTIGRFLPGIDFNDYSEVYPLIANLKTIAERHNAAIIAIHHTRKSGADDYIDAISGSNAFSGAADTIMVLSRGRGNADGYLQLTGRDIEESEIALKLAKDKGWQVMGTGSEYRMSQERKAIYDILKNETTGASPSDISKMVSTEYGYIRRLLPMMVKEGLLVSPSRGIYKTLL